MLLAVLLLCIALGLSPACASKTHPLLEHQPEAMTDQGIVRYYHDLDRAIAECEREMQESPGMTVGGGASSSGGGIFGVTVTKPVNSGCNSDPLRQRQVRTAQEMRKRGIMF